ncbi:PRTRC system protein E [Burkholderia gladioli]|uniref:PRTRC system protein E n=1 Tax=Burkholderia gladioli TaxID=28095 RepID=UPI001640193F|nr:PRTRC system protein E [Burkholderia gladioli]
MPLFQSLHELALVAPLNILISDDGGGQLRVNVTPQQTKKSEQKLWPLSVAGTPAELDEQFAHAVAVYQPGALSILDQARACASANNVGTKAAALPASKADTAGATEKPRRGRPPKNRDAGDAPEPKPADGGADPRQLSITDDTPANPDADVREDRDDEPVISSDESAGAAASDDGLDVY